ncbi:MAG: hypothetical protein AAFU67_13225, partial [Bacteroidota bacterium]
MVCRFYAAFVTAVCLFCTSSLFAQSCPNAFSLGNDTTLCGGGSLTIAPITPLVDPLSIDWSPDPTLSVNANGASATVMPTMATTYQLTVRSITGPQLVFNGDFTQGDAGFSSDYTFGNSSGGNGPLDDEGQYRVTNSPPSVHDNYAACGDQTTGTGNMLVVNGASNPVDVWCQTITVTPGETYAFSAFVTSMVSENPAVLQFSINGVLLGSPFAASPATCLWTEFFELWESNTATSAEICINNQNTANSGNDFAIDDISFRQTCLNTDDITVTPVDPPVVELLPVGPFCERGSAISLTNFLAFGTPLGGTFQIDGLDVDLVFDPSQITPGIHTLSYTSGPSGCTATATVNFNVEVALSAGDFGGEPTATLFFCGQEAGFFNDHLNTFDGDLGGNWSISGGQVSVSIDPLTGTITANEAPLGSYIVQYVIPPNAACEGDTSQIELIFNPVPLLDIGGDFSLDCTEDSRTISNINGPEPGLNYQWFRDGQFIGATTSITIEEAGQYQLVGTFAASGCTDSSAINVADISSTATLQVQTNQPNCGPGNTLINGNVAVTEVIGGTPPYLYRIDEGIFGTDSLFNNLSAGMHTVEVEDAGGCRTQFEF